MVSMHPKNYKGCLCGCTSLLFMIFPLPPETAKVSETVVEVVFTTTPEAVLLMVRQPVVSKNRRQRFTINSTPFVDMTSMHLDAPAGLTIAHIILFLI